MLQSFHSRRGGFTLAEIMIVVAIIAMLAAIAVPGFLRSRKRSQATLILRQLKVLDEAVEMYAMENSRSDSTLLQFTDMARYVKVGTPLYNSCALNAAQDLLGNSIPATSTIAGGATTKLRVGVPAATFAALSDAAPASFWSPFPVGVPQ